MKASTKEADKIYDYYIKMEEIIFKYIQDQYKNEIIIENIKALEDTKLILDEKDKILENTKQILELKDKILEEKNQELNKYKNIKYVETTKSKHIYIFSTDIDNVYKIGKTKNNPENRKNQLQTGCVKDIKIIYDYNTSNDSLLESFIHTILSRYQYSTREHFACNLTYIKDTINIVGLFFESLKSTYANITRKELIEKLIEKLNDYLIITDDTDPYNSIKKQVEIDIPQVELQLIEPKPVKIKQVEIIPVEIIKPKRYSELQCDIITWFKDHYELTNNDDDIIKVKDIYEKFTKNHNYIDLTKVAKIKYNKTYFVNYIETNKFFSKYYCAKTRTMRTFIKCWKYKYIEDDDSIDDNYLDD
jgi:hypothetical protein